MSAILERHDQKRDHDHEEPVAPRELEPRERISGERPDNRCMKKRHHPRHTSESMMPLLSNTAW